jgi:hypothetical protein
VDAVQDLTPIQLFGSGLVLPGSALLIVVLRQVTPKLTDVEQL